MKQSAVAALAILLSNSAMANLVETINLVKNPQFQEAPGADPTHGQRLDWAVQSGLHRHFDLTTPGVQFFAELDGMEDGVTYRTSSGGHSDNSKIYQDHTLAEHGINTQFVDTGLVTMDMSWFVDDYYGSPDRSRMQVSFMDENDNYTDTATLGWSSLTGWAFRELNDFVVPTGTRGFRLTIHHDRVGNGYVNSTGIALPDVRFAVEDNEAGRLALSTMNFQTAQDVPVYFAGLSFLSLMAFRRRKNLNN